MDHVSKEIRSKIMAGIRSRGNATTELALGKLLCAADLKGYRKHWPVAGKPDFAWPGRKVAVFVDGCFWHGCPKHATQPATNRAFWRNKFARNKARDRVVNRILRHLSRGWNLLFVQQSKGHTITPVGKLTMLVALVYEDSAARGQ